MVDDFVVCGEKMIASACLETGSEAAVGSNGGGHEGERGARDAHAATSVGRDGGAGGGGRTDKLEGYKLVKKKKKKKKKTRNGEKGGCGKMIECRICQEEGEEGDMEAPCACTGTLKFAHRKCIQRWCNKKGDIVCEICNQTYSPNYYVPPSRVVQDCVAIDIRQSWGGQIELDDPHFLALAAAQQQLLNAEYEDFSAANNSGILYYHYVAFMLLFLLLVRQAILITGPSETLQDAPPIFNVSLLQLASLLLPCFVLARSCFIFVARRRRQL